MPVRFPAPLRLGDTVAVTAPSSGDVQPFMPIVNGALGHLRFGDGASSLEQTLA